MNTNRSNIGSDSLHGSLKKGEGVVFETLFRLYYDKLLHISKGYLGCLADAEEIVQNVFLKELWENKERLKHINHINSYLYSMTRNACLDQIKHEKIKHKYFKVITDKKNTIQHQFIKDETASLLIENELAQKINKSIEVSR